MEDRMEFGCDVVKEEWRWRDDVAVEMKSPRYDL